MTEPDRRCMRCDAVVVDDATWLAANPDERLQFSSCGLLLLRLEIHYITANTLPRAGEQQRTGWDSGVGGCANDKARAFSTGWVGDFGCGRAH